MIELLGTRVAGAAQTYVDDVFSTYLYTGNGSTQTITNGIDLSGQGGLVWGKRREAVSDHVLVDTVRGATHNLSSNATYADTTVATGLTAFNSDGFSLGSSNGLNANGEKLVSWTFRKAAKFFDVVTYTGNGDAYRDGITHSLGITPGMVIVKATSTTGDWIVWHRASTNGGNDNLALNQTLAAQTGQYSIQDVTSTKFAVANDTSPQNWPANTNGDSYVAYLFAHDTTTDGIIQCGSFTTDGSGNATVSLGWEPQFVMLKSSGSVGNWISVDNMRAFSMTSAYSLSSNLSNAESTGFADATYRFHPTANGFQSAGALSASTTYIYLAIRRPNKPPTSGSQVYNAIARTGTGAAATVTGVGFAPDLVYPMCRNDIANKGGWVDKLRGASANLTTNLTDAESTNTQGVTAFGMDGISVGTSSFFNGAFNYINYFFRRAPGVFDVVCYKGTGSNKTESHNLTVAPELWIVKGRSGATAWAAGCTALANTEYLVPNTTAAKATGTTYWNSTYPTSSVISLGTAGDVNTNTATYVAYLFATKAGISKVGSYTGNGTNQTINCGFSGGARFILIKRTDSTGDWYVWDSTRGIVAGNDPHLSLNTTAAEVTTDDSIDPDSTGFIVNQDAATNINVNTATYIYLAFA